MTVGLSVRSSVSLSYRSTAAAALGGFAAERRAGRRYRGTRYRRRVAGAGAQQQRRRSTALSSKCGQRHADSRRRGLKRLRFAGFFCYTARSRGAEYCDERVRVSVTLCFSASVSPKLIRYSSIFKTRAYHGHG